jgi:hypothetical protein
MLRHTPRNRLCLAVLLLAGCASTSRAVGHPSESDRAPDTLEYRGLAIQLSSGHRPVETISPLLPEIADLGANTVLFSPAGYMEHARSQAIFIDARHTPSAAAQVALIRLARKLGLRVIVMPIVLLSHPRGSEWRGVIDPPEWDDWWRQYREFVEYFADIARQGGADALIVGSELVSTEKYTDQWLRTIELAREHFGGSLGYSANWDHYKPIQFWDRLDFVGMTSYYTLADQKSPSVEQIVERWKPIRAEILDWQRDVGKPIVLTEVGWCSQEGAAMAPWNYYQNMKATPAGHEEQRRLYEAFIKAWEGTEALGGVIWWEWTPASGGSEDYNYTPRDKPAEKVLRAWFKQHAQAAHASN